MHANYLLRRCALASLLLLSLSVFADSLPRPPGLEPDIAFWRRIFTEIGSGQALIHDDRHLGVIYGIVGIPVNANRTKRRRIFKKAAAQYRSILNELAGGKRAGLTPEQARVLSLWPADISNDELRQAARRLRFQQGLADRFRDGLIRSGQWQDYIRANLRTAGVPESLAALPHVESSFDPTARSHVGAAGLWQFTRSTGKRFMRIDHVVDERRDPYISSESAAKLLQYNYSILGSWPLAIVAYNHGVAGMRRAVRRMGTDDIEVIVRNYNGRAFGFASRNFYVAFLAALEVEQNAARFFGPQKRLSPRKDLVVVLPDFVLVDTLEKTFGVSRRTMKIYNPSLKAPVWNGSKYVPSGFKLRLPGDMINSSPSLLLASIPNSQRFDEQTPDLYHKVRWGETLSLIASRYRTSVTELFALNSLKSRHRIRVGQVLRLPYSSNASGPILAAARTSVVPGEDTLDESTGRVIIENIDTGNIGTETKETTELVTQGTVQRSEGTALLADPSDYLVANDDTIEVQAAETLGHYADWLEIRTQRLRDLNGYTFRQPLVIGRRLSLKFDRIDRETFSARRIDHHRELQETFFNRYRITGKTIHRLRKGDSIWHLSQKRYKVPVWLLRQYNPDLNLDRVMPGIEIVFPRIEVVDARSKRDSVATNNQSAPPSLLRHTYSSTWHFLFSTAHSQ